MKALPPDILLAAQEAIRDLLRHPIRATRRLHPLRGYRNPKVYTIDVLSNHCYKISLEIQGDVANLRRVDTHKMIDNAP